MIWSENVVTSQKREVATSGGNRGPAHNHYVEPLIDYQPDQCALHKKDNHILHWYMVGSYHKLSTHSLMQILYPDLFVTVVTNHCSISIVLQPGLHTLWPVLWITENTVFWIRKMIWFAHNGIITIHCSVTMTAAETFVHQIRHEWFYYTIQCYQWGTCSSFLYHSKPRNQLLCLAQDRHQSTL